MQTALFSYFDVQPAVFPVLTCLDMAHDAAHSGTVDVGEGERSRTVHSSLKPLLTAGLGRKGQSATMLTAEKF